MKFGYTIIYVPSVSTTVEFYERAFKITRRFVHESGEYAEMETGATALAFADEKLAASLFPGFRPNKKSDAPAGAEIAFVAGDVQAAFDHALASGAVSILAPVKKPWGQTVSYVRDNNGFLVEICSAVN